MNQFDLTGHVSIVTGRNRPIGLRDADIAAELGVSCSCGVAANPDGSIEVRSGDEVIANEIERRAKEQEE